jgi:antitoxin component HigA of HigAB toxin-antitoxin module
MIVEHGKASVVAAIRSDEELELALRELCDLMSSNKPSATDQRRIQYLADAIGDYEDQHYPIPEPCHASLLKHLLDAKKVGVQRLSHDTRISVTEIQAVLAGHRQVERNEAAAFADYFAVDVSVFDPRALALRQEN